MSNMDQYWWDVLCEFLSWFALIVFLVILGSLICGCVSMARLDQEIIDAWGRGYLVGRTTLKCQSVEQEGRIDMTEASERAAHRTDCELKDDLLEFGIKVEGCDER